jgi:maleylacetate reductase
VLCYRQWFDEEAVAVGSFAGSEQGTMRFIHETLAQRVIFDAGRSVEHLEAEVERLGAVRVMLVGGGSSSSYADRVGELLPVALRWSEVVQHVPVGLADRARAAAAEAEADLVVCVGGGSAVGLAKAVALTSRLPVVAVPTTYAGSEATPVWGLTDDRHKTTGMDPVVLPRTVVYDSELTLSLPVDLSVASGFNALAHCVDSMWASASDPLNRALALEGVRALAEGLPRVVADPRGTRGRDECLYGAHLSATAFASAGSGLHHKICHVLGGAFDLPHAQTHAIVLPHVLAFNAPSVPDIARRLADALGGRPGPDDDSAAAASDALAALEDAVGAPRALRELGLPLDVIPEAAERIVAAAPSSNPCEVTRPGIEALLRAAWEGADPRRAFTHEG